LGWVGLGSNTDGSGPEKVTYGQLCGGDDKQLSNTWCALHPWGF